jgi:hypothetical protein
LEWASQEHRLLDLSDRVIIKIMSDQDIIKALDTYFNQDRKFIDTTRIPLICQDIRGIHKTLEEIRVTLDSKIVTRDQFSPIQKIVYGGVGLILTSVVGALLALVIMQ